MNKASNAVAPSSYSGLKVGVLYAVTDSGIEEYRDTKCPLKATACSSRCELFVDGACEYHESIRKDKDVYRNIDNLIDIPQSILGDGAPSFVAPPRFASSPNYILQIHDLIDSGLPLRGGVTKKEVEMIS